MRIVHITAGAGGRICGTCLHDNSLVRGLRALGCDAILLPAYVPTTTDEQNVAEPRVVLGGVNVYLQEHLAIFRHTPWFFDRLLDWRFLLEWLSSRTSSTRPADLGSLTVSTLRGEAGRQAKEVEKLARWLAREPRPDIVHLSNVLLVGLARRIRRATGARIVATLSGEDVFVESIPEPWHGEIRGLLRERASDIDQFIALNQFFADFMTDYLAVPRERIEVLPHGVDTTGYPVSPRPREQRQGESARRLRIGSLARACPEKGLHLVVEALAMVRRTHDAEVVAAGATVDAERTYLERCLARAAELGVAHHVHWLGEVERNAKVALLASSDVFVMPTTHPEAKGIPVLEAMAAGVPVVVPRHGTFPEYVGENEGQAAGVLFEPKDPVDFARAIRMLLDDPSLADACGRRGHARVRQVHSLEAMARGHERVYARLLSN